MRRSRLTPATARTWILPALILILILNLAPGCRSTDPSKPRSDSLVWIIVPEVDLEVLHSAIESVFQEESYVPVRRELSQLVYEKPGSRMNGLAYGSWMNNTVWVRVKVRIKPYIDKSYLLESDVYLVRHRGDSIFEEERESMGFKKKPFRQQLEKIKQRVRSAPPSGA